MCFMGNTSACILLMSCLNSWSAERALAEMQEMCVYDVVNADVNGKMKKMFLYIEGFF